MGISEFGQWLASTIDRFADYIKPWVVVNGYEEAIILRWGKYHRTLKPGTYWKWMIADYAMTDHVKPDTMEIPPITITTADGKPVSIGMIIHYDITDLRKFLVENNDSRSNMLQLGAAELSDHLEDIVWTDIKKKTTKNAVLRKIAPYFDDMGVRILDLKFKDKVEVRPYKLFTEREKIF